MGFPSHDWLSIPLHPTKSHCLLMVRLGDLHGFTIATFDYQRDPFFWIWRCPKLACHCRRSCWRSTTSQLILSAALRLHGRRVYSQNAKRKCRTHMQNCNDCYGSIALVPGRRNWTCTLRSRGPDMFRDACNPEALQSSEKSTLILFGTANLLSSLA